MVSRVVSVFNSARLCVGSGTRRRSGCLGCLSARRPRSHRLWFRYFWDCLSRVCLWAPHSFPYFGAFYSSGSGPAISQSSRSSVVVSILSLSIYLCPPPSAGTPRRCLSGPSRDCRTHYSTRTAMVFIHVDSFVFGYDS